MEAETNQMVRKFCQILLWPLQLLPLEAGLAKHRHWELLERDLGRAWKELDDEFGPDPEAFQERHYSEFVTFLPYVQRLLYGEGAKRRAMGSYGESPIKVYRRTDVAKVRVVLGDHAAPITFDISHADLYFFDDVDLAILALEISGRDVPLNVAQEMMSRFGRAYPSGWTELGEGLNCPRKVEWLAHDGSVLATSDYENRSRYLASICRERSPLLAAHWQHLLSPMVPHHTDQVGAVRFRPLECYRMPLMAYLAVDHPERLTRADFVRLAFATGPGDRKALPFSERFLARFEETFCYDRYFDEGRSGGLSSRVLCSGHAFVVVGDAARPVFVDAERGILGQFRHQFFLLGLIAHFHKAALLMLSDRMVQAVTRLDVGHAESVRRFRGETRNTLELFLRFTHRYWFHEVSDQILARDIFHTFATHLRTERLYAETREELHDMGNYLDSDLLRRQSKIMLRLTVVIIIGLVGTTVTGFLGMNLIAAAEEPFVVKLIYFTVVTAIFGALTIYTLVKARSLADFLDALSDEHLTIGAKAKALLDVWRRKR